MKSMSAWPGLLARVRPHRRTLAVAAVLALLGAAGGLAQPLAAREVLEALSDDRSLLTPLLILGGLVVFSAAIVAIELWLLERTSERVVLGVRRELATRLLRLRLSAFDREAPGDLVARATSDSTLLGSVASTALVQLLAGTVTLLGAIVLMGVVDLVLLGVTAGVLVVVGSAVAIVMPRIMRATERQQEAVGSLGAALERTLGALRTVKASGAEQRESEAIGNAAEQAYRRGMESAGYQAVVGTATGLMVQVAFLAVLGVGGARVASGDLAVADLIAFLLYLFYLTEPIASVVLGVTQLQQGLAAVGRIEAVQGLPVEAEAPASPVGRPLARAEPAGDAPLISFERVCFGYRSDRPPCCTTSPSTSRLAALPQSSVRRVRARRRCSPCSSASTSPTRGRSASRAVTFASGPVTCFGHRSATSSRRHRCSPARCATTCSMPSPAQARARSAQC